MNTKKIIKTGLVSVTFRSLAPEEVVNLASRAGIDGIEWGGDIHVPHGNESVARAVCEITRDRGLAIAAYGSYYRAGWSEDHGLSFDAVLASAIALGAPTIRVWAGTIGSGEASQDERESVAADLRRITSLASAEKIGVSLEFHSGTLADTAESAADLLKSIHHPSLKTYWQPRVGASVGEGISEIQTLLPWLGNVHVFHWWPDAEHRLPLRLGASAWKTYFDEIQSSSSSRFAMLEFVSGDSAEQFLEDARTLRSLTSRRSDSEVNLSPI